MKLINTMLVGVFAFSMLFAQPGQQPGQGGPPTGGPPQGGPPQGGPDGDMNKSAADHFMMAVQEGLDRGVLDANDQEYLMGMVPKMKEAVDSEYNDDADGAAGEVVSEFESGYKAFMMKVAKALKLLRDLQWNYAWLNLRHIE